MAETDGAEVEVRLGQTISLGGFEFARCDVGVTLPTKSESLEGAYEAAYGFTKSKLQGLVKSAREKRKEVSL